MKLMGAPRTILSGIDGPGAYKIYFRQHKCWPQRYTLNTELIDYKYTHVIMFFYIITTNMFHSRKVFFFYFHNNMQNTQNSALFFP